MKNLLKKIWAFIAKLWKTVDEAVEKATPIAIKVVDALKTINETTTGDIIEFVVEAVIPGNREDAIIDAVREKLRKVLPKLIAQLNIAQSIAAIEDPNEQLKAIVAAINLSPDETKNMYYHGLCTLILQSLADGKLSWSESVQIAEYYYVHIHKQKQ